MNQIPLDFLLSIHFIHDLDLVCHQAGPLTWCYSSCASSLFCHFRIILRLLFGRPSIGHRHIARGPWHLQSSVYYFHASCVDRLQSIVKLIHLYAMPSTRPSGQRHEAPNGRAMIMYQDVIFKTSTHTTGDNNDSTLSRYFSIPPYDDAATLVRLRPLLMLSFRAGLAQATWMVDRIGNSIPFFSTQDLVMSTQDMLEVEGKATDRPNAMVAV